jgi:hypothetical protein
MRYVICLRSPVEVARSLARRDDLSAEDSSRLWLKYVSSALRHTEGKPRLVIFYEHLLNNGNGELSRLAQFLGVPERAKQKEVQQAVQEFIDPGMRHFRANIAPEAAGSRTETIASSLYAALRVSESLNLKEINGQEDMDHQIREALDVLNQFSLQAAGKVPK